MTLVAFADYLGLTIETVSRTMSRLGRDGLMRLRSLTEIELTDGDALHELMEA